MSLYQNMDNNINSMIKGENDINTADKGLQAEDSTAYDMNSQDTDEEQLCLEVDGVSLATRPVKSEIQKIIEAVLFALSRPVSIAELVRASGAEASEVQRELKGLTELLLAEDSPLIIRDIDGRYQMCTSPLYFDNLVRVVSTPKKPELSEVMMETLAIIANKNPSTKVEIEKIRGVKSDFAVNKLIEYGLVEEKGRLNAPGKPILFGPTDEFYRRFGVDKTHRMPKTGAVIEARIADEVQVEINDLLGDNTDKTEQNTADARETEG